MSVAADVSRSDARGHAGQSRPTKVKTTEPTAFRLGFSSLVSWVGRQLEGACSPVAPGCRSETGGRRRKRGGRGTHPSAHPVGVRGSSCDGQGGPGRGLLAMPIGCWPLRILLRTLSGRVQGVRLARRAEIPPTPGPAGVHQASHPIGAGSGVTADHAEWVPAMQNDPGSGVGVLG